MFLSELEMASSFGDWDSYFWIECPGRKAKHDSNWPEKFR
jgi:hypothetical protein